MLTQLLEATKRQPPEDLGSLPLSIVVAGTAAKFGVSMVDLGIESFHLLASGLFPVLPQARRSEKLGASTHGNFFGLFLQFSGPAHLPRCDRLHPLGSINAS